LDVGADGWAGRGGNVGTGGGAGGGKAGANARAGAGGMSAWWQSGWRVGDILRLWGWVRGDVEGEEEEVKTVYVRSDLETVDAL
jgi:hypothetical protein